MSYLILQAKYKHGRTKWHEVWQGHDPVNAEHFGGEFARLNESPVVIVCLRDTGDGVCEATVIRRFDRQGVWREPGEAVQE